MKKPKKTLKELTRLEAFLAKQTSRSAKILTRHKESGAEPNPVTASYYERIAAAQAVALADHSEIAHLIESLSRTIAEAQQAKAQKSRADKSKTARKAPVKRPAARKATPKAPAAKRSPRTARAKA